MTRRRPRPPRHPRQAEARYRALLRRRVHALAVTTERELLRLVHRDPPASDRADGLVDVLSFIEVIALAWTRVAAPEDELRSLGGQVDAFTTREALSGVVTAQEVRALPPARYVQQAWIVRNVRLIKSIDQQYLQRVGQVIREGYVKGDSAATIGTEIRKVAGITRRRAKNIARDQVGTLNSQVTRKRHLDLGVTSYRWRTSQDERVRPEHVAREGRVFTYDNPPDDGNPGEPPLCRCTAEAVLDEE